MPLDHIQCSASRRFGPQSTSEDGRRFTGSHIAGPSEVRVLPAADQADLDLVPIALDQCAVQMPIPITHHYSVGLDHQHSRRRVMLVN
jgi:hypothetical protein